LFPSKPDCPLVDTIRPAAASRNIPNKTSDFAEFELSVFGSGESLWTVRREPCAPNLPAFSVSPENARPWLTRSSSRCTLFESGFLLTPTHPSCLSSARAGFAAQSRHVLAELLTAFGRIRLSPRHATLVGMRNTEEDAFVGTCSISLPITVFSVSVSFAKGTPLSEIPFLVGDGTHIVDLGCHRPSSRRECYVLPHERVVDVGAEGHHYLR